MLFRGEALSGKLQVALDACREFLARENSCVVVSTYNRAQGEKFHEGLGEGQRERATVVTVGRNGTDTDLYLAPRTALVIADELRSEGKDVLLV